MIAVPGTAANHGDHFVVGGTQAAVAAFAAASGMPSLPSQTLPVAPRDRGGKKGGGRDG